MKSILLAFALLFSMAYASRASANECGGNLIDYKPVWSNGKKVGELAMYYNGANGNNCAVFNHAGPTWGVVLNTRVGLQVCTNGSCPTVAEDWGNYAYRAGPVRAYGRGKCAAANGALYFQGQEYFVSSGVHCR